MLNDKVINIGDWDYQYIEIDGEQVPQNPLPEGATIEERDFEFSEDRGWHEVGSVAIPTDKERIEMLEDTINFLLGL